MGNLFKTVKMEPKQMEINKPTIWEVINLLMQLASLFK